MAERGGFEPPIPFQVRSLSRRVRSTTLPPLRNLLAVIRMTIINEWLAGRYFPQVSPQTLGSDEYLLNVNAPRRYTPDLRSVAFVESRPC
jgi:hypothetical protein